MIVGICVSITVTTCVHVAVFPDPSTTVQVTVVLPKGYDAGPLLVTEATEQLSAVAGEPKTTPDARHDPKSAATVTLVGQTIVGSSVSVTVTVCVHVETFPDPSTTVHVTVVFPKGYVPGALFVTEATVQLSAVIGEPRTTPVAEQVPDPAATVTSAGQVIVGSSISVTVTVCVHVAVFPEPSVTVHTTVVVPIANATGALFVTEATEQLSAVVGVPSATPVASHDPRSVVTATGNGQAIIGFWLSTTVTV